MNYSELLQLAKGWGNFLSDRIIIWRLRLRKQIFRLIRLEDCGNLSYQKWMSGLRMGMLRYDILFCMVAVKDSIIGAINVTQ